MTPQQLFDATSRNIRETTAIVERGERLARKAARDLKMSAVLFIAGLVMLVGGLCALIASMSGGAP